MSQNTEGVKRLNYPVEFPRGVGYGVGLFLDESWRESMRNVDDSSSFNLEISAICHKITKKSSGGDAKKILTKKIFSTPFWVIFDFWPYLKSAILEGMPYLPCYKC